MRAITLIALLVLGWPQARAEKAPSAIDRALLDTILENQLQEESFQKVTGHEPLEHRGEEPTLLRITTGAGIDFLPHGELEAPLDDIDVPQLAF